MDYFFFILVSAPYVDTFSHGFNFARTSTFSKIEIPDIF